MQGQPTSSCQTSASEKLGAGSARLPCSDGNDQANDQLIHQRTRTRRRTGHLHGPCLGEGLGLPARPQRTNASRASLATRARTVSLRGRADSADGTAVVCRVDDLVGASSESVLSVVGSVPKCGRCCGKNQIVPREDHLFVTWTVALGEQALDYPLRQARRGHLRPVLWLWSASVSSVAGGGLGAGPSQHEYFFAELLACGCGVAGAEQVD